MIQRVCALLRWQPPVADNRGLLGLSGATVPTDGTDGYQTGCLFLHTDGGNNTSLYVNEGSVTSCQFNSVTTGGPTDVLVIGAFASLLAGSGIPISSTQTGAALIYSDDDGANIATSCRGTLSRFLLTYDQSGGSIRALMGQLKLATGVDVATGIYTGVQGYVELAGDHTVSSGATFSCFDASLEVPSGGTATVASGGEMCGLHVETTGSGSITNNGTCAAVLISNASGAPVWPYGVYVTGASANQAFVAGVQGTGVPTTTTYPFAVEIHNEANADIVAGDTGSSAGIYNRYEIQTAQTSQTNHISVFAKLRPKANMADGIHCGVYAVVEASETIEISGTSTTMTCAGHFALDLGSGVTVSAGHLNGIVIDSSINASATTSGTTIAGLRMKKSGTSKVFTTGIVLEDATCTTGINIGTCTTAIAAVDKIVLSPDGTGVMLDFELETQWTTGSLIRADFGSSTTYTGAVKGIDLDLGANIVVTSEQSVTGVDINLPQMTMTAASPTLTGVEITAAGAFTLDTSGAANFYGVSVTTPAITQTAGTVVVAAFKAVGGTLTSGAATGLALSGAFTTGVDVAATCTTGVSVGGGTVGTGISILACTTAALRISGDQAIGILFDVDESATDGLKMSVDSGKTLTDGVEISGAGTVTTGILMNPTAGTTGLNVGSGFTTAIAAATKVVISPNTTGVMLDFELETQWTTGSLIRADFGSSTTYSGAVIGTELDLGTNIVATGEQSVTGVIVTLPQSTNDAASPALVGFQVAVSGAMTAATSGDPTYCGVRVATPAIDCTLDTIVSTGVEVTTGQCTQTGGTATSTAFLATGGTLTSGSAYGLTVAGAFTTGINITATVTTGVSITGTTGTGLNIGACTTAIAVLDVITVTPDAAGTLLDFVLETEWVSGTLIRADFASSTTYTGTVIGAGLDLGSNIVATSEQSVTGVSVTLPQSTNDAASPNLKGLQVAVSGAMTTATSGTATYRGVDIATPAITQTAGSCLSHGVYVSGGAITTGTAVGAEFTGAFSTGVVISATVTTGISISGTTGTGLAIGACSTAAITCLDVITISPNAAGTLLDFELETEWVSGTLIRADFGSSTTFSSAVIGAQFDLGTNIVATSEQSVTGVSVTLPQSTNDAASPALRGVVIAVSGAMTATTSGDPTYIGVEIATPAIDCTLDTIVSTGLSITTGQCTQTGGTSTSTGALITGGTLTSGTANAVTLAGAWTAGVNITATVTTGISISGTTGVGVSIGACTTNAIACTGECTGALVITGGTYSSGAIQVGAWGTPILQSTDGSNLVKLYAENQGTTAITTQPLWVYSRLGYAGNTSSCVMSIVGAVEVKAGTTANASTPGQYLYGVQGRAIVDGTVNGSEIWMAGVAAEVRETSGTYTSFKYMAPVIAYSNIQSSVIGGGIYAGVIVGNAGGQAYDYGFLFHEMATVGLGIVPQGTGKTMQAGVLIDATTTTIISNAIELVDNTSMSYFLKTAAAGGCVIANTANIAAGTQTLQHVILVSIDGDVGYIPVLAGVPS